MNILYWIGVEKVAQSAQIKFDMKRYALRLKGKRLTRISVAFFNSEVIVYDDRNAGRSAMQHNSRRSNSTAWEQNSYCVPMNTWYLIGAEKVVQSAQTELDIKRQTLRLRERGLRGWMSPFLYPEAIQTDLESEWLTHYYLNTMVLKRMQDRFLKTSNRTWCTLQPGVFGAKTQLNYLQVLTLL